MGFARIAFYILLLSNLIINCLPVSAEESDACKDKVGAEKECCDLCVQDGYKDGRSKLTNNGIGQCNDTEDPKGDLCCCSPKK